VELTITCTGEDKTVGVSRFNSYVERLIKIPEGIDPAKITTGIVLNADGTFSHVPTVVTVVNGKYYARISSLTNSIYTIIWNSATFKDTDTHWAKGDIDDMGSRLIISGVGEGDFKPDRAITRAEFAAMVMRALGLMRSGAGKDVFRDVKKGDWYYDAISLAFKNGIISGDGNGMYWPNDKITREQAFAMIARAMKLTGLKPEFAEGEAQKLLAQFEDDGQAADWSKDAIASCIQAGVLTGRDGKLIAPTDNITRAETASIIRRLLMKSKLI
jgi:hypothetical protein